MLSASLPSLSSHPAPACCETLPREGEGPGCSGGLIYGREHRAFREQQGLSGWFLAPERRWLGVREVGDQSATSGWGTMGDFFPLPGLLFLVRQGR